MASKRPKPEEIVSKLRQVEVLMGQGMSRLDAIRQIGVVEQTYYRWRKQYGGMGVDQLKELKRLQKETRYHLIPPCPIGRARSLEWLQAWHCGRYIHA